MWKPSTGDRKSTRLNSSHERRSCMVLELKPMGKLVASEKNQVLERTKVLHGLRTQTFGETSCFRKNKVLDRTKVLHGPRTQTYGETSYFQKTLNIGQNQGLAWSSDSNLWGN